MQLAPRQLDLFLLARSSASNTVPVRAVEPVPVQPVQAVSSAAAVVARPRPALDDVHALAANLASRVGESLRVSLAIHDNTSTMVSFVRRNGLLKVRLHHAFLAAPDVVVQAVADYAARGQRSAGRTIDHFIASRQEAIRPKRAFDPLDARGRCHDLQQLFDELNAAHFDSAIQASIGWGRHAPKRRRASIRLGVYDHRAREIRIHPALDAPDVPRFFVAFIVFHEMLHQLFPSDEGAARRTHHPRAFRVRERSFPQYDAAMAWEKEHVRHLLRR